jgi:hypothetical protein
MVKMTSLGTRGSKIPTIVESVTLGYSSGSAQLVSSESEQSMISMVKGFSPSHVSSSYRSVPLLTAPLSIPTADIAATKGAKAPATKKNGIFDLVKIRSA